jgi:hypothetical protein
MEPAALPIIRVTWRDHYGTGGWKDLDEVGRLLKPDYQVSVGWLVAEDAHRLVIVQTHGTDADNPQVKDSMTIEKSCVVERVTLEEP